MNDGTLKDTRTVNLSNSNTDTTTLTFSGGASNTVVMETSLKVSHTLLDSDGFKGNKGQVLVSQGASNTVAWEDLTDNIKLIDKEGTHSIAVTDTTILVSPPGPTTLKLPPADKVVSGKKITIKRANQYDTTNTLKVESNNNNNSIDEQTAYNLNVSYQGYTLQAFGNNWHIIQRF